MNLNTILKALLLAFGVVYLFTVAPNAEAQTSSKTLSQQLADEEEKARRGNTFQGEGISAEQALSKARQGARADVNDCPPGSVSRKPEDVRYFITSQERLQEKIFMDNTNLSSGVIKLQLNSIGRCCEEITKNCTLYLENLLTVRHKMPLNFGED